MGKVKLGDIAVLINGDRGKNYPSQKEIITSGGIPFVNAGHLNGRAIEFEAMNYITPEKYEKLNSGKFQQNDILYCLRGSLGKKALINDNIYGAIASSLVIIRPNLEKVRPQYLMLALETLLIKEQLFKFNNGSSQPNLSAKSVKEYKLELPDLFIQDSIISKLEKVRNLIEDEKQEKLLLDNLIQARFVEMFGDAYLNEFGWKKIKIKNAVTVEPQNGMYKPQSDYVTDGSGIPILRIDGFYDGVVTDFSSLKRLRCSENERQKYLLYEDDVVINRVNSIEYLGKCAHINGLLEDTVYESNMMRMHFDSTRFHPVYVCRLLCSRFVYDQIVNHAKQAVNQASINQKDVLDFDIYEPPLKLQIQFADFVRAVDKSKVEIQKALDKTQMLFDSLMQEYFG